MAPIRTVPSTANSESRGNPKPPTGYNLKRVIKGLRVGAKFRYNYEGVHDGPESYHYPLSLPVEQERPVDPRGPALKLKDLECVGTLGEGTGGYVLLVRKRGQAASPPLFALKSFSKKAVRSKEQMDNATWRNRERTALVSMEWNPFIAGILDTFYDARNMYMMLEYSPCGTLHEIIVRGVTPVNALFYFANIVCGLQHLHKHGFVHRDLKPGNILVGSDGYLSLCDFGPTAPIPRDSEVATEITHNWFGEGTLGYQAPEIITLDGQPPDVRFGTAIDWWAAGTILFLMATTHMPFKTPPPSKAVSPAEEEAQTQQIWEHIMARPPNWPPQPRVGPHLKALVEGLLTVNANARMGLHDVMQHPWLATVDWTKMRRKRYLPPSLGIPASEELSGDVKAPDPALFPGLCFAA
ncbi:kinase-like domain-containing protein [Mycena rosella]|uniref:cAMP-dependent protein kinase n=1 Tax=Mycena rosella TaxID=1033263 RepID=A0AAD7GEM6_MYCRO|nr:kinase-like domain-containing protein [Mycena rosella]